MKDFTLKTYETLINSLLSQKYQFFTMEEYFNSNNSELATQIVILRHDVDRKPQNALRMAKLEAELGIKATYYFRTIPQTFKPDIIEEIAKLGHEVGYHYENLSIAQSLKKKEKRKKIKGEDAEGCLYEMAIKDFEKNLKMFKRFYPVKTMCMHGSPMSKWDNRNLWEKYDYRRYGIICEPYFDIDYDTVFYITDTGRQWNNSSISVRDKVKSAFDIKVKGTNDLINKVKSGELPDQIMINTHPHRWFNFGFGWINELIMQNIKNMIKKIIVKKNA